MATINAAATGNWSAPATWIGGVLPGPGDIARANGYTVTIDQDISVKLLSNGPENPAGTFRISSVPDGVRNISITDGLGGAGAEGKLYGTLTISAPSGIVDLGATKILGTAVGDTRSALLIDAAATNVTVKTTGAVTGAILSSANSSPPIISNAPAGCTLMVGSVAAGNTIESPGIRLNAPTTVVVSGSVVGGASSGWSRCGILVKDASSITAGSLVGSGEYAILVDASGKSPSITCLGLTSKGIYIQNATSPSIDLRGGVAGTSSGPGLYSGTIECLVRVSGNLSHGDNNWAPLFTPRWTVLAGMPITWTVKDSSALPSTGADVPLSNAPTGSPDPADVREGVTYGAGGSLVGTLDTAGNSFALADVASVVGAQLAAVFGT